MNNGGKCIRKGCGAPATRQVMGLRVKHCEQHAEEVERLFAKIKPRNP